MKITLKLNGFLLALIGLSGSFVLAETLYQPARSLKPFTVVPFSSGLHDVNIEFNLPQVDANPQDLREFGKGSEIAVAFDNTTVTCFGAPNVQGMKCLVQVPDTGSVEVVLDRVETRTLDHLSVAPSQYPALVGQTEKFPYVIDQQIYASNGFYPQSIVSLENCQILREIRVATVHFNPVRYNPVARQVELVTKAHFTLRHSADKPGENELHIADKALTPGLLPMYQDVLNFDQKRYAVRATPGCYLFMGSEKNLEAVKELIEWKKQKGFVVKTAIVGQDGVPTDVKGIDAWIENAYNTWDPKPEYLLLVGSESVIPAAKYTFAVMNMKHVFGCDNDYGVIGTGQIPSISVGRITANKEAKEDDPADFQYQVWKTLKHDKEAIDGAWRNNYLAYACHSQGFNDGTGQKMQKEWNGYLGNAFGNVIKGTDKNATEASGPVMDCANFMKAWNEGASLLTYIGHGNIRIWGNMKFDYTHVPQLTNGEKFPIVWSVACLSGAWMDNYCLYERFLSEGSVQDPKGAVGIWGYATNSGENVNNMIANAFKNYFQKKIYKMGPTFLDTRKYAKYKWDSQSGTYYGCPEIDLYVGPVQTLKVEHGQVQEGAFTLNVTNDKGAVENAMVGVVNANNELLGSGYTDTSGAANLTLKPVSAGEVTITVSAHNCRPYQAKVQAGR